MVNGLHLVAFLVYLSFKMLYNTCQHSHTHIHTLMAETAVQGANLLIRSNSMILIQGTLQCFKCSFTHTLMTQPSGAIWGSVSYPRTLVNVDWRSWI